jgi:DNA-binding transcriptional MerR regulator
VIGIKALERRIDLLEGRRQPSEPDLIELTLARLSDRDLELLHELNLLRESGFDDAQIEEMLGKRYPAAQKAIDHFHKQYEKAEIQARKTKAAYRNNVHGIRRGYPATEAPPESTDYPEANTDIAEPFEPDDHDL